MKRVWSDSASLTDRKIKMSRLRLVRFVLLRRSLLYRVRCRGNVIYGIRIWRKEKIYTKNKNLQWLCFSTQIKALTNSRNKSLYLAKRHPSEDVLFISDKKSDVIPLWHSNRGGALPPAVSSRLTSTRSPLPRAGPWWGWTAFSFIFPSLLGSSSYIVLMFYF